MKNEWNNWDNAYIGQSYTLKRGWKLVIITAIEKYTINFKHASSDTETLSKAEFFDKYEKI